MSFFYQGPHKVSLDAKSRIAVPTEFRPALDAQCQGALTLTRGNQKNALWLFPRPVWEKFRANLRGLRGQEMRWRSHFVQNARDLDMDSAGRIVIPATLREMCELNGPSLLFAGDGDYFEIRDWDLANQQANEMDFSSMPDSLFDYDLPSEQGDA